MMLAAIALVMVSLTCLVLAAREWHGPRGSSAADPEARAALPGGLVLLGISLVWFGGLWTLTEVFGWSRERTLWLGFAAFLAVMTVVRPSWFWENHRARRLRGLIGDEQTALLYLLLAVVMAWLGLFSDWTFGRE
jgi:hypothetical protein